MPARVARTTSPDAAAVHGSRGADAEPGVHPEAADPGQHGAHGLGRVHDDDPAGSARGVQRPLADLLLGPRSRPDHRRELPPEQHDEHQDRDHREHLDGRLPAAAAPAHRRTTSTTTSPAAGSTGSSRGTASRTRTRAPPAGSSNVVTLTLVAWRAGRAASAAGRAGAPDLEGALARTGRPGREGPDMARRHDLPGQKAPEHQRRQQRHELDQGLTPLGPPSSHEATLGRGPVTPLRPGVPLVRRYRGPVRSRAGRWVSLHALSAAIVAGGTVGALARFALDETIPVLDGLDGTILGERRRARFFSRATRASPLSS